MDLPETFEGLAAAEDGPAQECAGDEPVDDDSTVPLIAQTPDGFNCEPLDDLYQVRWAVEGDMLAVELVGLIGETDYLGFGPSGRAESTFMVGADVVVADMFEGEYRAQDYYMSARAQCSVSGSD